MLLLFAYFFDAETYNHFNQIYYTASLIILFSSLGFNIAVTRINISLKIVFLAVLVNALLVYLILQIVSDPFNNLFDIVSILIYSVFISASGIFVFHLLFIGRYKDYVLLTLLYSIFHLLIIPAILFFHINFFTALPIAGFLWFSIVLLKYTTLKITTADRSFTKLKEFYKIGISAFVINSAVSLALAADKYFVNHFFNLEVANSYTFAWGLTAPMFYIGVIIEQYLFSELNTSKSNILKKGFSLSTSLVILYAVCVLFAVYFFPAILPTSVNYSIVISVLTLMISGYSIYVIFHFPVNVYLFKSLGTEKQKNISIIFSIIISAFVVLYIVIMQEIVALNYLWLLIITWSYIFILLITKVLLMFRKDEEGFLPEPTLDVKNLEP